MLAAAEDIERDVEGKIIRNHHVLVDFQRSNPCPVTKLQEGSCTGYVKDHIIPLCAGGRDAISNLKWSERDYSLLRDKEEWALCRGLKEKGRIILDMPKESLCSVISAEGLFLLKPDICK
jgi:hypothetical protein